MPRERADQPSPELDRDLALAYAATFIPRYDQYPLQLEDGTYVAIKQTLHPDLIVAHLKGIITIGAYALSPDGTAQWICLDADTGEQWNKLQQVSASLAKREAPSYLEPSRRGGHLWLFLPQCRVQTLADLASSWSPTTASAGSRFTPSRTRSEPDRVRLSAYAYDGVGTTAVPAMTQNQRKRHPNEQLVKF